MKKLLTIVLILSMINSTAQVKKIKPTNQIKISTAVFKAGDTISPWVSKAKIFTISNKDEGFFKIRQTEYPASDTLPCYFLQYDKVTKQFSWQVGFVVRENGMYRFLNIKTAIPLLPGANQYTSVQGSYLPISSGLLQNLVFYSDMKLVTNDVIQLVIKPLIPR